MKKIISVSILCMIFSIAPHALAAGFVALAPIPGLTSGTTALLDPTSLAVFFNNLYKYLIGIAAILAVIEIIRGGLEISVKDSVPMKLRGKSRIYSALSGLVLVLSPYLVFSIINPSILNLSLNLPPIIPATNANPTVVSTTACTTTRTGSYLIIATCPSDSLAKSYPCPNNWAQTLTLATNNTHPVFCGQQTTIVEYYTYTNAWAAYLKTNPDAGPFTAKGYESTQASFNAGCAADTGKVAINPNSITMPLCPANAQIPSSVSAMCKQVGLQCVPSQ